MNGSCGKLKFKVVKLNTIKLKINSHAAYEQGRHQHWPCLLEDGLSALRRLLSLLECPQICFVHLLKVSIWIVGPTTLVEMAGRASILFGAFIVCIGVLLQLGVLKIDS